MTTLGDQAVSPTPFICDYGSDEDVDEKDSRDEEQKEDDMHERIRRGLEKPPGENDTDDKSQTEADKQQHGKARRKQGGKSQGRATGKTVKTARSDKGTRSTLRKTKPKTKTSPTKGKNVHSRKNSKPRSKLLSKRGQKFHAAIATGKALITRKSQIKLKAVRGPVSKKKAVSRSRTSAANVRAKNTSKNKQGRRKKI